MAITYKGVQATKVGTAIPTLQEEGTYSGRVHKMYDSFTLTADLAVNDLILMGSPLPEGAQLMNCKITTGALGGSCALSFGFTASNEIPAGNVAGGTVLQAADSTAFFNALVCSSAVVGTAGTATAVGAGGSGDFYGKVIAGPGCQPQILCTAVSSSATGKIIQTEIDYLID